MPSGPSFDPYAVLQVLPTADQEVINAAFKALAMKYHPDRDATRRAADKMAELNRAYAILRDGRSRLRIRPEPPRDRRRRLRRRPRARPAGAPPPTRTDMRACSTSAATRAGTCGTSRATIPTTSCGFRATRRGSAIGPRSTVILRTMGVSAA